MNQLMKFPETAFFEKKQNKIFNDVIRHIVVFVVGGWFLIVDFKKSQSNAEFRNIDRLSFCL